MSVQVSPGTKLQISIALLKTITAAIEANEDHVLVETIEHDDESGYVRLKVERPPAVPDRDR